MLVGKVHSGFWTTLAKAINAPDSKSKEKPEKQSKKKSTRKK